jgi:sortase A
MTTRLKTSRRWRWIERFFLLVGVVGVAVGLGAMLLPVVWQDWENWDFDRRVNGQVGTYGGYLSDKGREIEHNVKGWLGIESPPFQATIPSSSPSERRSPRHHPKIAKDGLIGRITIPRLNLSTIVREGTTSKVLSLAAGHIPGTALPGEKGNIAVAGHRDTLFRGLKDIKPSDVIDLETLDGRLEYQVASTEIVKPEDVAVLKPGPENELTLVTCYPFYYVGSAPDRFIVKARQVSQSPIEPNVWSEVKKQNAHAEPARQSAKTPSAKPGARKVNFTIATHHSRELAPGVSLGITDTDVSGRRVDGWMWLMADRRTIWLRAQRVADPLVFYSGSDGKRRQVTITNVTSNSATGYLSQP